MLATAISEAATPEGRLAATHYAQQETPLSRRHGSNENLVPLVQVLAKPRESTALTGHIQPLRFGSGTNPLPDVRVNSGPPPAPVGDAPELLDVDMDQFTGPVPLVPHRSGLRGADHVPGQRVAR